MAFANELKFLIFLAQKKLFYVTDLYVYRLYLILETQSDKTNHR